MLARPTTFSRVPSGTLMYGFVYSITPVPLIIKLAYLVHFAKRAITQLADLVPIFQRVRFLADVRIFLRLLRRTLQ